MRDQSSESIEWRPVIGYEGLYEVSSVGEVRRVAAAHGTQIGRVLRPWLTSGTGYPTVTLARCGAQKKHHVHRLVTAAFLGPQAPGIEVNHKDGSRDNNRVENLEYVTRSGNMQHAHDTNPAMNAPRTWGERVNTAKLTERDVRAIRDSGEATKVLAGRYGVSTVTINYVRRRATWKHIA